MNPHRCSGLALAALAAAVFLAACSNPVGTSGPYDVVIQVYNPTDGPGIDISVYCDAWLYDSAGVELAQGETITYANWPRIVVTLDSGTYYLKVMGINAGQTGPYAVAALAAAEEPAPGAYPSFTALADNGEDFEDDGPVDGDGLPTNPASLAWEGARNRYLAAGETDWVRLDLP